MFEAGLLKYIIIETDIGFDIAFDITTLVLELEEQKSPGPYYWY